jgi:ElaB/YqjD/DUF883 family membrane-anchored ribosome-binding protein
MPTTQDRVDDISRQAHDGVNAGQRYVHQAVDRLADRAADWTDQAAPVVDRVTEKARGVARQGAQWARDNTDRVREQVARASDRTVGYVRDEPVRSVLMAAAAGAVLFAIVRLLSGRSDR